MKSVVLFCGGGLVDTALPKPPLAVVDNSEPMLSAHAANHSPSTRRVLANLLVRRPEDVCADMGVSSCDLLWASPLCQPWSSANNRGADRYDPRMPTLLVAARYARILRPRFVVVENVSGLADRRPGKTWLRWLTSDLHDAGYAVADEPLRLNAVNFSGCQVRRRIFVIGIRNGCLPPPPQAPFPYSPLSLRDVIGHMSEREAIADGLLPMSDDWQRQIAPIRQGALITGTKHRRLQWDGYCDPLRTTPCIKKDPVHVHPAHARFLSVREYACIMGVPKYQFPQEMSVFDRYCVIGQGIPPFLARVVIEMLMKAF